MSTDGNFDVVWPLARSPGQALKMNPRLRAGEAKRIGFLWDYVFRGDEMFPLLQAGLAEEYPGSSFVHHDRFGNIHGHNESEVLASLPERLRAEKIDAVVVGVAN
jgi:hypothetical protein